MSKIVGTPAGRLKLDALNQPAYNHFKTTPKDITGKPLVGSYKRPEQIYELRAFIPVRRIMTAALEQRGPSGADAKPLLAALSEQAVLTTPAHQFALPEGLGNRVLAYSTEGTGGVLHTHIDQLVHELKKQNMRVIKLMTLFSWFVDKENPTAPTSYAQGGTLKEILADSVGATWHSGGYSAGFDEKGQPTTVKSDWPTDYGPLTDKTYISYNAHLVAIDYQGGVRRPVPAETLAAYYRNADLWDCARGAHRPVRRRGQGPDLPRVLLQPARGLRPAHPAARRQQHGQAQQGAVPQAARRLLLLGGPVHGRQPRAAGILAGQEARVRQHGARQADRYLQRRARLQGHADRAAAAQSR